MEQYALQGRGTQVLHKKASPFASVEVAEDGLRLIDRDGEILYPGYAGEQNEIVAWLYADRQKNLTMIVQKPDPDMMTLLFVKEEDYKHVKELLKRAFPDAVWSKQNEKINGYASTLVEKLKEGTTLRVIDAIDEEEMLRCPVCGMQVEPGMAYCMECGAELTK